jgi:hypothetical protein
MHQFTDTKIERKDSGRPSAGTEVALELNVRSLAPPAGGVALDAAVARLEELDASEVIDEYGVHVWGRRIATDTTTAGTDAGEAIFDRLNAFHAWADRTGMSLDSFFAIEETRSTITGETYEAVVLPTMTLAEYEGDDLRFVTPCTDGTAVYTVPDRLDALVSEEATPGATDTTGREQRASRWED